MIIRRLIKVLLRAIAAAVLLVVGLILSLLLVTGFEHRMPLELPAPAGPFAVSRTTFDWVDDSDDEFAPVAGTKRELLAWVWYPSAPAPAIRADYLPPLWRTALSHITGVLMSDFLTRDLSQVRVHSTSSAGLSPTEPRYPVLILRAGLAALVTDYTALAEDLASRGYIVVGPDAPYRTTVVVFPDGRVVSRPPNYNLELLPPPQQVPFATRLMTRWSTDIGFAVDELAKLNAADPSGRFTGHLDLQHLGVVGHSLGGATAAHFCHEDSRCTAGVDLDGQPLGPVILDGLRKPFMFVLSDHGEVSDPEDREVLAHIESIYQRLPTDSRLRITIVGSNHFSFSDHILLKSQVLLGAMRRTGVIGGLEGRRGLAITTDYVATFFDVYLKDRPRADLDALARKFPEAQVH
jgi:dienelactone hydrolase